MNKIAFDLYNCQSNILADGSMLYDACVALSDKLNLDLYYKPTIVPYFYGKNEMDEGVSCFCLYKNKKSIGMFTLHSFSRRNIVYFDIVSDKTINENKVLTNLIHLLNPGEVKYPSKISENETFGLEIKLTANSQKEFTIDMLYALQDQIIKAIDMTQITNTMVKKSENMICLISLIAESHLALFYNLKTNMLYMDLFSCKYFDKNVILSILGGGGILQISSVDTKTRGSRHFDNVKYSLSHEEILKIKSYLLCYGLAIDEDAFDYVVAEKPYIKDKGFVHAFNINICGRNTCVSTAEKFSGNSQFCLNYNKKNKQFYIHNDEYRYIPINIFEDLPKTYTIIDQIAKPHSLTCVSLWPSLKCCFAQDKEQKCKFCSIEDKDYDIIPAPQIVDGIKKLFEKTYEYSLNIGGGTYKNPDYMIDYLSNIIKDIREFSDTAISCEIAPPKDLKKIEQLKHAGCNSLIINLEVANDNLRAEVCPAKHNISYEHYYKTYKHGVEIFGKGKVSCVLVVGIQPDEDIINECKKLVSIGVIPTLIPFKAMDNCYYNNRENCNPKNLVHCAKELAKILAKNKLSPCNQLGCTKCGGCSLEVDYARMLQNF